MITLGFEGAGGPGFDNAASSPVCQKTQARKLAYGSRRALLADCESQRLRRPIPCRGRDGVDDAVGTILTHTALARTAYPPRQETPEKVSLGPNIGADFPKRKPQP
eukprot:4161434-Amphidinium_carterae.1